MDQIFPHDDTVIASIADWMSVEELAGERWETPLDFKVRSAPTDFPEDELPF